MHRRGRMAGNGGWRRPPRIAGAAVLAAFAAGLALLSGGAVATHLPLRRVTSADGLPHDQVRAIHVDARGFVWFATEDGLSRFDGESFRNYGMQNGLASAALLSLLETRDGVLWVGTEDGLCRFEPAAPLERLFDCRKLGPRRLSRMVLSLLEDPTGAIWAGTADGLFRVDRTGRELRMREVDLGIPDPTLDLEVGALAADRQGCLWAGTTAGLLRRCGEGPFRYFPLQPRKRDNNRVFGLLVDRAGRLWAGLAYDGVLVFMPGGAAWSSGGDLLTVARRSGPAVDAASRRLRLPRQAGDAVNITPADGLAHSMARGGVWASLDGTIWMGTIGGLSRFDGERVESLAEVKESIRFAGAEDRAGNLWFGTEYSGALRVNVHGFVAYDEEDGLPRQLVHSVFLAHDGAVHAVTLPNVFCRFDGRRFTQFTAHMPAELDRGWSYHQTSFQDSHGEWWVATGDGLLHFPATARTADLDGAKPLAIYSSRGGSGGSAIFRLFEDSRHDIWISSLEPPRVTLWERATATIHLFPAGANAPDDPPTAFAEDRAGNVWIGFYHGGLARYAARHFTWYPPGWRGAPAGWVGDLYLDHGGRLWVASAVSGLSRIDDPAAPRPHLRRVAAGLGTDLVHGVIEDAYGRLYVCTGRGVDRLDLATGGVVHLTVADGLPTSAVMSTLRDRAGSLWFATSLGLARLSPGPLHVAAAPPATLLMGLRIDGRTAAVPELGATEMTGPDLEPGEHRIEIAFVAIGSEPGEAARYQHRLAGGAGWSPASRENRVTYEALAPGGYDFLVRAMSSNGRPGRAARLAFRVLAPWWREPWVLAAAAACLAAMAYGAYRFRLAHLLSLERVRTRLATDLHDDLGASLSRIALLSEVAAREIPEAAARPRTIVREIGGLARELFDATADIVWAIDPRRDDLGSLAARLSEYAIDVLSAQEASWSLHTPHGLDAVAISGDWRRELFLLLKEAVHNAARHSGATAVSLTLAIDGSHLRAEVCDNGRGFPAAAPLAIEAGDGLRNMQARAAALGGTCEIDSALGRGTRVRVAVAIPR
jgi:ligand-binding sensor domain-containing protein/signal transduction histidine kinase